MKCKICGSESTLFSKGVILNKYNVSYYKCTSCGFMQTEEPYWLNEAYSSAIAATDIGLVERNIELAEYVSAVIKFVLARTKDRITCLDYGGGYGLFVRLMRDRGFAFEWYDKYCDNLFAKGFELSQNNYDIVTAFEFFEHVSNPIEEIGELIKMSDTLIFSTLLLPEPTPTINDWWYYSTETGQHVSFYTDKSLQYLAERFSRNYYGKDNIHIISKKKLSKRRLGWALKYHHHINKWYKRDSLLSSDYEKIKKMLSVSSGGTNEKKGLP